ncbi:MAG: nucleosidase [Bacteroidales bacterium]
MKILVTYALEAEKGNIRIPGCTLVFYCTGIGKVSTAINTYEALLNEKPDLVMNIGTAGTLSHQVGEILICSHFFDRDLVKISNLGVNCHLNFEQELDSLGLFKDCQTRYVVSTGDTFQTSQEESGTEGDVFDMESYAAAQTCKKLGFPYVSVKYVTDVIGQNSIKHWEDKLQEAREGLIRFLYGLHL